MRAQRIVLSSVKCLTLDLAAQSPAARSSLKSEQYIDDDNALTMKGHNELNNDDNRKEDKET
jgi:hypothetical protein